MLQEQQQTEATAVAVQEQPLKAAAPAAAPATEDRQLRVLHSWIRDLILSIGISLFIILFVYQPVKVEGGSMEPGLQDQERIFINKLAYKLEDIQRGDIVVFRYPRDTRKSFIKRVIGLPGDHVRVFDGRVYLNGRLTAEPYVPEEYLDSRSYPEVKVPSDCYFVLGDHRSMSQDSRDFGPVQRSYIYGKAVFGYWPMEKMGVLH